MESFYCLILFAQDKLDKRENLLMSIASNEWQISFIITGFDLKSFVLFMQGEFACAFLTLL